MMLERCAGEEIRSAPKSKKRLFFENVFGDDIRTLGVC
jgi:hypothetical protein